MPLIHDGLPPRLRRKLCLTCGYEGPELQGEQGATTFSCPGCGEDLYARPARSYGELEGFEEMAATGGARRLGLATPRRRAAPAGRWRRWLGRLWRYLHPRPARG